MNERAIHLCVAIGILFLGIAQLVTHFISPFTAEPLIHTLYVSPAPYPFVGLPRNKTTESPYKMSLCSEDDCMEGNYLSELKSLPGPHRYRAAFYLLPLEDFTANQTALIAFKNVMCHSQTLPLAQKLTKPITHFILAGKKYDCQ